MNKFKILLPALLTALVIGGGVVGRVSAGYSFNEGGIINSKGRIEAEDVTFDATDFQTVIDAFSVAKESSYTEGYQNGYQDGLADIIEKPFVIDNIYSYGATVDIDNTWRTYAYSFNITMHPNSTAITMMNDSRCSHQYVVSSNNDNIQVDHVLNTGSPQYVGLLRNTSDEEQTATIYMQNSIYGGTGAGRDAIAYYIFTSE